jgi:molybdopterin converting factor subunit 1
VTVRVLLFAQLRERCGTRETSLELSEGATVADAWGALCARFGPLAAARPRFAVNQEYVDGTHRLHENDELALIPPVSGGSGRRPRVRRGSGPAGADGSIPTAGAV